MAYAECSAAEQFLYNIDTEVADYIFGDYVYTVTELALLKEEAEFEYADTRAFEASLNLYRGVLDQRKKELAPLFIDMDEEAMFAALDGLDFSPETEEALDKMRIKDALNTGAAEGINQLEQGQTVEKSIEKGMISATRALMFSRMSPTEKAEYLAGLVAEDEFEREFTKQLPSDSLYKGTHLSWHQYRTPRQLEAPWAAFIIDPEFAGEDLAAVARIFVNDRTGSLGTSLSIEPDTLIEADKRSVVQELHGLSAVQIGHELTTAFSNTIAELTSTTWSTALVEHERERKETNAEHMMKLLGIIELPAEEKEAFDKYAEAVRTYNDTIMNAAQNRDWATSEELEDAFEYLRSYED